MNRNARERRPDLRVESLEGRRLLSGLHASHASAAALTHTGRPELSASQSAAFKEILNALGGNPGSEFVKLLQREVHNPLGIVEGFMSGAMSQYSTRGFAAQQTNFQSQFTGFPHDVYSLSAGGAVALKGKKLELGAIVRGPFTTTPFASQVVFAINRGAGQRLGPHFASRPAITPDALVTVTIGPYGQNNSASITDLTTGTTTPISSPVIGVAGPTVRIVLDTNQLPSEGFPLKKYTFSVWTESQPNAPIQDVGSFVPDDAMVPIAIETNVKPTI